jgi:hypothetical protein
VLTRSDRQPHRLNRPSADTQPVKARATTPTNRVEQRSWQTLVGLLDASTQLPSVAVVPGEVGIGKTTRWLATIDAAAARGYRIMACWPSEAETRFTFAGLGDLLGDAAREVLPELRPIQRRALEGALLLGESAIHADDRAVSAAFLGALHLLAHDRPLCPAITATVQCLDTASAGAPSLRARAPRE